jgi:hypothetical protein
VGVKAVLHPGYHTLIRHKRRQTIFALSFLKEADLATEKEPYEQPGSF